ncbi:MAG: UDP-N-acetylglucosamine 2-epimerase (non-hydrolyzing) [Acidimicrobiia bacterium]|nr:UDP-N-acetylglucosamine 2-epimerase (non-hydrolyzing) [Acidimicrobiia bacterium]
MRIVTVAGARPNFVKVAPISRALEARDQEVILVHTGQHYDERMSHVFFAELGMRAPDHHLQVGSGSHAAQTGKVMTSFEPLVDKLRPDVVVVVGDVNSTLACALVAAKAGPLVAHVEAGLRSRDWAMPEEVNRAATDRVSDYLLASSPDAVENLRAEGYREDQVHLVGNVMVDSLLANLDRARARPTLSGLGLEPGGYGLVTLHRPSNVDDDGAFRQLLEALGRVARRLPLVFPAHPRAQQRAERLGTPPGVRLVPPAGYLDFLALQGGARVVLTDSGGVQEETTVLGVPCLTLRETTERPITVDEGTNRVVGVAPDRIVGAVDAVLEHGVARRRPELWDGKAAERIADVIMAGAGRPSHPRPTDRAAAR